MRSLLVETNNGLMPRTYENAAAVANVAARAARENFIVVKGKLNNWWRLILNYEIFRVRWLWLAAKPSREVMCVGC